MQTWLRASELLNLAVVKMAKSPQPLQERLYEVRSHIFELDGALNADQGDDGYVADINKRIAQVKDALAGDGAMLMSTEIATDVASEIVELASAVRQGAKDERS